MNAFEMITLSQGLNLSALFDRRQVQLLSIWPEIAQLKFFMSPFLSHMISAVVLSLPPWPFSISSWLAFLSFNQIAGASYANKMCLP